MEPPRVTVCLFVKPFWQMGSLLQRFLTPGGARPRPLPSGVHSCSGQSGESALVLDVIASGKPPSLPILAPMLLGLRQLTLGGLSGLELRPEAGVWCCVCWETWKGPLPGGGSAADAHGSAQRPSCFACVSPPPPVPQSLPRRPVLVWLPSVSPELSTVPGTPQAPTLVVDEVHSRRSVVLLPPALLHSWCGAVASGWGRWVGRVC